jgi:LysM repeat protein
MTARRQACIAMVMVLMVCGLYAAAAQGLIVAPSGSRTVGSYTVKSGDTLYKIGQECGCDYKEICSLNKISNCDMIDVGQSLKLPSACKCSDP